MRATSAIILAAGQGTRMKSKYPKVMAEVLFKPMINWVTDWCLKAGIEKICVVVGSGADQVRAALPQQCVTVEQTRSAWAPATRCDGQKNLSGSTPATWWS